jgi:YVTN family beta-propeller protein
MDEESAGVLSMKVRVLLAVLLLQACTEDAATSIGTGSGPGRDVIFAANAEDGTVSVIDAQSFAVVRTLDILPDGPDADLERDPVQALLGQRIVEAAGGANYAQDLDLSPDGRVLYVSRGHRGDVAAFDLASGAQVWKTPVLGLRADHMTLSGDGSTLYVSDLTTDVVHVVAAASGQITGQFATGEWPHDNHLSHDGTRLYNGSIGNILVPPALRDARTAAGVSPPYRLTVVDTTTLATVDSFVFERGVRPFEFNHDETRLYAQLSEYSGVIEFDLAARAITRTLDLPVAAGTSEEDYDFEAPHHGLALSHDGATLCLAGRISDYVALVDVATFSATSIIPVGDAPSWATVSPDGRYCFVANNRDATVSVISLDPPAEVARIPVGLGPKFLLAARLPAEQ